MDLETVWYEAFPFLYGVAGVIALCLSTGSTLLKVAGTLLIIPALVILRVRWVYRRSMFVHLPSPDDLAKPTQPAES